jgi:plasmid stability protein
MLMATLQVKDVPDDLHRELRRRADLDGLSIRDYLLRLIRNDQQRPPATEWLARLRRLEPLDLGAPAADLVQADRAVRDLEALPEQRQS